MSDAEYTATERRGYSLPTSMRSILTALGLNAIPAIGWFVGEWSAGTMLVLYWLETLIGTLLVALRIVLHRRLVPSQGHWNYEAPKGSERQAGSYRGATYLTAFLLPALVFTIAHGFFLGVLGLVVFSKTHTPEGGLNPDHLLAGLIGVLAFQLIDFIFDLISLRTRSFAWIERLGQVSLSRVIVIHLTIIGGMAAVMLTGANRNFFGVFIFLKTLLNLSLVTPQWKPKAPPAWLSSVMDRVKPSKEEGTFAEFWVKTDEQEAARIVRNEAPIRIPAHRK